MSLEKFTIGMLAGGTDPWWNGLTVDGSSYKALVSLFGRPMWQYVADALPQSSDRVVIGEWIEGDHFTDFGLMLSGTGGMVGNMKRIIDVAETDLILFVTCDLPALTCQSVDDVIANFSQYPNLGIGGVVVAREICNEQFPAVPRTFVKLKEGDVTFANLVMMRKSVVIEHLHRIQAAYERRKSPSELADLAGWPILFKFLGAQFISRDLISTDEIIAVLQEMLHVEIRLYWSEYAEVAEDVDKVRHLLPMLDHLSKRITPSGCLQPLFS